MPAYQVILLRAGDEWLPVVSDKRLVKGWTETVTSALKGNQCDRPSSLASDLATFLVDPSKENWRILHSVRDVRRIQGRGDDKVPEAEWLTEVADLIRQPRFQSDEDGQRRLLFFTWDYFGGEVRQWKVSSGREQRVEMELLATHVGRFGYYH